ncbi:glutamate-rich protein 3 [Paralichthys olivaceus]|uniref:glutamate-rich protein 3 n=1 Tax=Paralichthys olivaceus TaxID=8255 RepID=UPI0037517318
MSHLSPGLISAYNSLTDKHLAGYFSNTRIRRHLQRAGLITRSGRIVPDKEYRHKVIQRTHQRHVRECLAQAIFHKVLEMERLHQIEIKRKLEEFASRDRVHKIKVERSRRYEDDIIPVLSPHPPTGVRGFRKQHSGPEGEHSESSESLGSSRPNTAPGKMQRPVRLKPIHSNGTTASLRRSSPYRLQESSNENEQPFNCTMNKESRRRLTTMETSNDISPYRLPVINNFVVTPVPPATKRKERGVKVTPSGGTLRGRRLRPTTATGGANISEDPPMLRSSVHQSRVCVNMVYFGKTVHLSHDLTDMRDDVKVFQQHCGGENLSVYKGKLREGESFQFISRRHRGFPFSLTFFLNGLQVERLSSCCEFKHRKGSRLGGRHGHFGFFSVEGASPCYKCIIAMGLDKKPTPPPKRVKEEGGREESVISPKDAPEMETEIMGEDISQPQNVESRVKEAHATVQSRVRDDYEEDFEADDEGPVEEANEKKSPSPSSDTETQVKERDASETEDDEKDDDIKSRSGSSCTGSDQESSDDEATEDHREKAEQTAVADKEETVAPPDEKDEPYPEEAAATEAESGAAKDPDLQDSVGDSTEIDISDTSVPSGQELKQSDGTSGEKEEEKTEDEGKQEEQGPERAKSVQEKLAEAIQKESQCSSEPELSDTSTEEEEEATGKDLGQKKNDVPEQQQILVEELKYEESVVEAEVVQDQGETSEPTEQEEDESEKELNENSELFKLDEDEKRASEEEEKEKLEDTVAGLHAVSEGSMVVENTASEPEEDTGAKCNDSEAAQKDVESEEKTAEAEEADTQCDEIGQGAKRSEADESSVSELDKKSDEAVASDTAEEDAMTVSETIGMKAEPSEEREALSCEEAPVSDTEERQQGDSTAASQTEVTTEDSNSSLEGSADTTVEKTADISEDSVKDEGSKDDVKKEEAEEVSKDGNQQGEGLGGEQREKSVEISEEVDKEKSEEDCKEAEGENSGEKEENEKDKKEEEGKDASKTEEMLEDEEYVVEDTKSDSDPERQTNEEPADEGCEVVHEEKADESVKEEGSESVENTNDEEESVAKGAVIDETNVVEEIKETKAERDEEKSAEAEKEERNEEKQIKDDKEKAEEGEENSAITEDLEKNTDDEKTSSKNRVESEDVIEAADGNKMTEDTVESEDAKKETEGASSNSERGEIDGENGEISTGVERNSHDGEIEASNVEENDEKAAEHVEDGKILEEEPSEGESTDVKEAESGDDAGKHDGDEVEQDHGTDASESEAQERGDGDKREESAQKDPEQEIEEREETEITEESKPDDMNTDREQVKQDENGNKPDLNNENTDSDLITNIDSKINEDQAQSSVPTDYSSGCTSHKLTAAVADGENGEDAEEASKASEEGASVLLKPQAQNEEAPNAEESVAVDKEAPEALAAEDSTDLVTNWVNMHQMSKYFETFVGPLEDLRGETSQTQVRSKEEGKSTELLRVETPPERMKMSEKEENEQTHKVESEGKVEAVESELESKPCEDEPHESDAIKDTTQEKEQTEVEELNQMIQTEGNDEDSLNGQRKGSKKSPEEDKDQKGPTQMQSDVFKTEVESIAGTHHSVASLKAESVTEKQSVEKTSGYDPEKPTETEETKYLQPVSKSDEDNERPASPGGPRDAEESWEKTDEQSREVMEITDFTTSKSDDGSQEESHDGGIQSKPSGGSVNGERRDEQLIQDIKRTLSRDRLSSFSVDETLFGSSSHPLLSAARTES